MQLSLFLAAGPFSRSDLRLTADNHRALNVSALVWWWTISLSPSQETSYSQGFPQTTYCFIPSIDMDA